MNDDVETWSTWPKWANEAVVVVETDMPLSFFWTQCKCAGTSKTFTRGFPERTHSLARVYIEPWIGAAGGGGYQSGSYMTRKGGESWQQG